VKPDKKVGTESVEVLLKAGVSRKEIFQQLGGTDDLARIIALVPSFENRKKHRRENLVLIVVLVYIALMKFFTAVATVAAAGAPKYIILFALLQVFLVLYLAVHVSRFRGWAYPLSGLICLYVISMSLNKTITEVQGVPLLITMLTLLPLAAGTVLGFKLKKNLCPDVGFLGAKTDTDGKYLFMNRAG
jgi:hypothetical protein